MSSQTHDVGISATDVVAVDLFHAWPLAPC